MRKNIKNILILASIMLILSMTYVFADVYGDNAGESNKTGSGASYDASTGSANIQTGTTGNKYTEFVDDTIHWTLLTHNGKFSRAVYMLSPLDTAYNSGLTVVHEDYDIEWTEGTAAGSYKNDKAFYISITGYN